ncbi:hypothetical protein C8J36_11074 [Rhizobium sp. PP-F2F-G48]|uniref:hypothetical protein n=1 Tax=Rhizobium sp. PP-F2F-G48 TaxID=2135651 RepID=UPI00104582C2|nr:hypothetical protein [Rhizobium sp. PP-F2F-G48]TCM51067.1 hypothetical protein C8J36_11074 [Rhizobium sp. PP-F2F-G48]
MAHVTFVHGISNKPAPAELEEIWLRTLAGGLNGVNLHGEGITTSMVYWADVLYAEYDKDVAAYESLDAKTPKAADADAQTRAPITATSEEASFISGLAFKLGGTMAAAEAVEAIPANRNLEGLPYERIPLPWPVKKAFLETFLRDVHHYLFNTTFSPRPGTTYKVQDEIRKRFVTAVQAAAKSGGPHIVVSHSMGTVIAYDCLKRVKKTAHVDGLITIGSPLGLDEVQDKLQPGWSRPNGYPSEKVDGAWINVFDRLDPVAGFDPFIANDFQIEGRSKVKDIEVSNSGAWRHSIVKYLKADPLRQELRRMLEL